MTDTKLDWLDNLKTLREQATPGPWVVNQIEERGTAWLSSESEDAAVPGAWLGDAQVNDAKLIAAMCNELPRLLQIASMMQKYHDEFMQLYKDSLQCDDDYRYLATLSFTSGKFIAESEKALK